MIFLAHTQEKFYLCNGIFSPNLTHKIPFHKIKKNFYQLATEVEI